MSVEAYPEAAALLSSAGWKPHDGYGVYTRDTLVMGFQPDGQAFHVKNWAAIMEGDPRWNADTPDTAEEAAAWLVERFKPLPNDLSTEATLDPPLAQQSEGVESLKDESNGETGEAPEHESSVGSGASVSAGESFVSEGAGALGSDGVEGEPEGASAEVFDADFEESSDLRSELLDEGQAELPALTDTILEGGDPWASPEPEAPQNRFYGLDDLDRRRNLRIGDVVQISLAKQEAIWLEAHATENEFRTLTGFVLRDTVNGVYTGDSATMQRFNELQGFENKATAVRMVERAKVLFLREALHPDLEAFDVNEGWP